MTEITIVLPKNSGLREAYIAILKMVYLEQRDIFLFHDFVYAVQSDCGISAETATNRCKELSRASVLKYINSGLAGHNYMCCVYVKNDSGEISYVDNLPEASRLIETQFPETVETEFLQIRKMNIQAKPSEMRFVTVEGELIARTNEIAEPIRTKGDDVIKVCFVTDRITTKAVCDDFVAELEKRNGIPDETKVSSGNEGSKEFLGEK